MPATPLFAWLQAEGLTGNSRLQVPMNIGTPLPVHIRARDSLEPEGLALWGGVECKAFSLE